MNKRDWLRLALSSVWESDDHDQMSASFVKALLLALDAEQFEAEEQQQFNTIHIGPIVELEEQVCLPKKTTFKKRKHEN